MILIKQRDSVFSIISINFPQTNIRENKQEQQKEKEGNKANTMAIKRKQISRKFTILQKDH